MELRMSAEICVIFPVYNEENCVGEVLSEWSTALEESGLDYRILALDDGSSDGTPAALEKWRQRLGSDRIEIVRHGNRGHGQTCMEGYRRVCESGCSWVLQIDSDGQCDPAFFAELWSKREHADVVYGVRSRRLDGWKRSLASTILRVTVRVFSGVWCADANTPYRLMRTQALKLILETVPQSFDLANIALAVQLKRAGLREKTTPIVFRERAGGEPSVPLTRFASKAIELSQQLLRLQQPPKSLA
jgi:dolichol-phosphate mannosyltransferase